ncbi:hypothetical protein FB451DRAFT_1388007 [Mycena latifolia]|nr:hypothetical protein FB451DRAFT_1388007 [Mycena latifolia]
MAPFFRAFPAAHPFFSRLTHTELSGRYDALPLPACAPPVAHTPRIQLHRLPHHMRRLALLDTRASLAVLVCFARVEPSYAATLAKDVRFVAVRGRDFSATGRRASTRGWTSGAPPKRRSGEIGALQFELFADDS